MNSKLEEKLCEKYPKIFKQVGLSPQESNMAFGCAHSDGWYHIIDKVCGQIQHHIDWNNCEGKYDHHEKSNWKKIKTVLVIMRGYLKRNWYRVPWLIKELVRLTKIQYKRKIPQVEFQQVKEKFGTLRIYYHGGDEYISGLVDMAQSISSVTCEQCGAPGESRDGGWIRTLCEMCNNRKRK